MFPMSVRIDKWLWAARFFKTRSLASRACELGRVQSHGQAVKASRDVHVGDMLQVTTAGTDNVIRSETLAANRASGSVTGALARRADDLYNRLDPASQASVRQARVFTS